MIVRRASKSDKVVAGGGAIEMELSKYLRDYSRTIKGKEQMLINAYAKALEVKLIKYKIKFHPMTPHDPFPTRNCIIETKVETVLY